MVSKIKKTDCAICKDRSCAAAHLKPKELDLLTSNSQVLDVKKGETIMREGALTSHIIYLRSGYVKEYSVTENNKVNILQIIKHHSYLGLLSLFGDKVNHYSYTALEDSRICYIDINVFRRLIKENGDFAQEVLSYVCKESLQNYHRIINRNYKNANGCFADVLIYLSKKINNDTKFDLLLSRQELADLIGISRENTTRLISKFKADGIINLNGKSIEIKKLDLLYKISKNG